VNLAPASLIFIALSSSALAQAAVGLAYEAPEGCPAERDFVAAVAARGAAFDGGATNGPHRVMVVAIRKQGDGFAGVFQLRDGETATDKREVQAPSCAEVVDAMAVVTAIALRPEIAASASPPPAEVRPPALERPPEDQRLYGNTFKYHHAHESVAVPAGPLTFDLVRTVTLFGGAMIAEASSTVMPRFDLDLAIANFLTTPDGAQRIMGPILRSRFIFFGPGSNQSPGTKTDLMGGLAAAFGLCVSPHYDSTGLVLLICGDAGAGGMSLQTTGAGGAPSKWVNFGLVGFELEALYNLTSLVNVGIKLGGETYPGLPGWSAESADESNITYSVYLQAGIGFRF
jgi:hypothetical protein